MGAERKPWLPVSLFLIMLVTASPCLSITWPIQCGRNLAPITSPFGPRCSPQNRFHAGIDVRIWETRNVVAVAAGVVVDVSVWAGYDWSVIIQHGSGAYTWHSGYHHMKQDIDVIVFPGQYVAEGQKIATATDHHLHFNCWVGSEMPLNSHQTAHPLRLFGDDGQFHICVRCPFNPVSALQVDHLGQLLEVGVGVGGGPSSSPHYTYIWNYEGNVRNYATTSGELMLGDCYRGEDDKTGVSPTWFEAYWGTSTYFTFPTYSGDWILNNPLYTYALSVDGDRITIEYPVSNFFVTFEAGVSETGVIVAWEVSEEFVEPDDYIIFKGMSSDEMFIADLDIRKESARSFSFTDTNIERGATYYYRVSWRNANQTISSGLIEVVVPGERGEVFLGTPYPNPFNGETFLSCHVPRGAGFDLSIYDVSGRRIKTLQGDATQGNEFTVTWNGTNNRGMKVAKGIYFFRLSVRGHAPVVRKVLVLE